MVIENSQHGLDNDKPYWISLELLSKEDNGGEGKSSACHIGSSITCSRFNKEVNHLSKVFFWINCNARSYHPADSKWTFIHLVPSPKKTPKKSTSVKFDQIRLLTAPVCHITPPGTTIFNTVLQWKDSCQLSSHGKINHKARIWSENKEKPGGPEDQTHFPAPLFLAAAVLGSLGEKLLLFHQLDTCSEESKSIRCWKEPWTPLLTQETLKHLSLPSLRLVLYIFVSTCMYCSLSRVLLPFSSSSKPVPVLISDFEVSLLNLPFYLPLGGWKGGIESNYVLCFWVHPDH
ncbi:uncharacterized protein LOC127389368 [Apus apus]|uniref:uncharacterized protein LOC127389368 n=1 Tax=Apus apus TaxID=8895 RepID=UPI0021F8450A|nr:uncharacterized protein LOC127389368 [Apus apus]